MGWVSRKGWLIAVGAILVAGILIASAVAILNPRLTRYVESDAFRHELEKETSKGLHFPSGKYAPIHRTGFLTAQTDRFEAKEGRKAMTKMDARGVTTRFNPWGVFLRRWQLDYLRIQTGEVGIQTYEPKPEPSLAKPWYHVFLPDRVYLKRVEAEPADVTWRLRDKPAGFFGTRLLITPHGRDFNYQATGGTMKMALIPDLQLRETRMLITKTLLTLYTLDLASGDVGKIHGEGTDGTREDKSVDFKINFERLPIGEWLPADWKTHVAGEAFGIVHWTGKDPKLESASGEASARLEGGRVSGLPFLSKLAAITKKPELENLTLDECSLELDLHYPKAELKKLALEDKGKFRIEGTVTLNKKSLGGAIQLGMNAAYLEWLPKAEEVFSREHDGYLWTTVHLSGTLDQPEQDLSPRIVEALKESPGAFLGVFFRGLGEWLNQTFGGK